MTRSTQVATGDQIITSAGARRVLAALRIVVGLYFLWAFVDKTFGLRFTTQPDAAWIRGGTPAQGFIEYVASSSPAAGLFQVFANPLGDALFMIGLLGIGTALVLGIGIKVAALSGTLLMAMMWLAAFPPDGAGEATNPLIDDHWIMALVMILVALTRGGDTWGLGRWWSTKVGDSWLR
ncbi:MAG: DoxX family protein [Actinomyces sp.]|uniref:DoxX family protein n=1 Tax=Actinomyces sp. TaxID=29317 RepID=UPI0026DB0EC7|nr:DoxX family protein [Actinomyces sp.]MDO4244050.1 DoxX family protein [Actinomyces sp.]